MKQIIIAGIVIISFACSAGRNTTAIPVQSKPINNVVLPTLPADKPLPSFVADKAAVSMPPAMQPAIHRKLRRPAVV